MIMERLIYIDNLAANVDAFILAKEFMKFGHILSVNMDYDNQFVSEGKGQIMFQTPLSAKISTKMNGVILFGKPLVIQLAVKKTDLGKINTTYTKIFIKNINPNWDDYDLLQCFEKFGDVMEAKISLTNSKSNGYGFVKFKQHSCAEKAVKEMNDKIVEDQVLVVEPYLPKEFREITRMNSIDQAKDMLEKSTQLNNLHVKNLPKNIDETGLRELFQKFGEIVSIKVARKGNQSKGFGFVAYKSKKDAEKARFRMDGYSLNSQILEVNFNQGREQRQHYLQILRKEPGSKKQTEEKKSLHGRFMDVNNKVTEPIFSFTAKRH